MGESSLDSTRIAFPRFDSILYPPCLSYRSPPPVHARTRAPKFPPLDICPMILLSYRVRYASVDFSVNRKWRLRSNISEIMQRIDGQPLSIGEAGRIECATGRVRFASKARSGRKIAGFRIAVIVRCVVSAQIGN